MKTGGGRHLALSPGDRGTKGEGGGELGRHWEKEGMGNGIGPCGRKGAWWAEEWVRPR
jgi:hypothetical protein